MNTSRMLLIAPLAIFGFSGIALYIYFIFPAPPGPFHDNLVPELIGFCMEGFFLVGLLSLIQTSRERARRKELWLSLRGVLRGLLSQLDIAFLSPNAEPTATKKLEEDMQVVSTLMRELEGNRLNLRSMTSLKRESIETISLARDMIPVAAQLSAVHMRWWIATVDSMRQLSKAQTREAVEQSVYLMLENMNEFDQLGY
ncbi:hypothetical protein [Aliikangiella coralliicola]|uniref:Uncharacterized protein n=1 Tax=Aliikangiella coralliicola TaxID=2592383 RepID=A0A545TV15_9GAMM|nr:hypothetical protein [Aliikangiella coralliicola]TQV81057.1 hypothetical protein FLL46_25940 [Aliikangiella coralliicola]